MKCPHCGHEESKVTDSRPVEESIKRRRECLKCQARFTTYETIENVQPIVVKKDGSREYFDKAKLLSGLMKACQKRPVDSAEIADKIEAELQNSLCGDWRNGNERAKSKRCSCIRALCLRLP